MRPAAQSVSRKRPKTAKPSVGTAPAVAQFCRRCGFRDDDPFAMHRHMTQEIAAVEEELARLRQDHGMAHMVTPEEAAATRGLHLNTVRKLCRQGTLRTAVEIKGRWLLDLREIEDYQPKCIAGWAARTDGRVLMSATNEEIDFLRSHQDWTAPELAARLGHPIDWVRDRRRVMRRIEGEDVWPRRAFSRRRGLRRGDDQADQICDLAREGKGLNGISGETGISVGSIRRILRENHVRTAGQTAHANGSGYAHSAVAHVKKLRAEGKSWRQTAEITGLPVTTCRHLAIAPEQRRTRAEERRDEIRSEILSLVARSGGCSIRAVVSGTLGGQHHSAVRQEITALTEAGQLVETRTNRAKILTIAAG